MRSIIRNSLPFSFSTRQEEISSSEQRNEVGTKRKSESSSSQNDKKIKTNAMVPSHSVGASSDIQSILWLINASVAPIRGHIGRPNLAPTALPQIVSSLRLSAVVPPAVGHVIVDPHPAGTTTLPEVAPTPLRLSASIPPPTIRSSVSETTLLSGKKYACDWAECVRSFDRPSQLSKHYRTHTREKPFGCDHCDQRFPDKSNRQRHISTVHDLKKPFICSHCSFKFARRQHLEAHVNRKTHKKLDPTALLEASLKLSKNLQQEKRSKAPSLNIPDTRRHGPPPSNEISSALSAQNPAEKVLELTLPELQELRDLPELPVLLDLQDPEKLRSSEGI